MLKYLLNGSFISILLIKGANKKLTTIKIGINVASVLFGKPKYKHKSTRRVVSG
jgi:hypothetical protein